MDRLKAMSMVVAVSETGSFSAASRKLAVPIATVSRTIAELEMLLKAELFQRSSRRMSLTDAGCSYVESCRRILEQVDEAERHLSGEYSAPKGDLAVTAPWGLGHTHLLPIALGFLEQYRDISLRLLLTDRVVSMVDEDVDVAIRIGPLPDSSMIATRVGGIRLVVCASPGYLAARGTPETLDDLHAHDCIAVADTASSAEWKFARGRRNIAVPIRARLTVNTSEAAVLAAIAGAGLARVMSYKMDAAKRAGSLNEVLNAFEPEPLPAHIVHAQRKVTPPKLRAFLDWITPRLRERLAP